jgi:hypothetical protein
VNLSLILQELAIVVATPPQTAKILGLEFLKYSGIVPPDWEFDPAASQNQNGSVRIAFKNGVNIVTQGNRLIFAQAIANLPAKSIQAAAIARKYITTLPYATYESIGINVVGYVPFDAHDTKIKNYITRNILAPSLFADQRTTPIRAKTQLAYQLDQAQFNLDIEEVKIAQPHQTEVAAILFAANFDRPITGDRPEDRLKAIVHILDHWPSDLKLYQQMVINQFLKPAKPTAKPAESQAKLDPTKPSAAKPSPSKQSTPKPSNGSVLEVDRLTGVTQVPPQ